MPSPVDKYFDEVKKGNPSYTDEQAWATAWSIYCKHKNPGSDHCTKSPGEYLTGKSAKDMAVICRVASRFLETTSIEARVAARFVKAGDHNPDPLTFKAFLSEFKQGEKTGKDLAMQSVMGDSPVPAMSQAVVAEEKVAGAASDLLELARRIETIAKQGNLGVNETRLSAKMSGILSTLFYQTGLSRGLKETR